MRQIGTDHNIDPKDPNATVPMPVPTISPEFEGTHQKWMFATMTMRQHRFCSNLCINFKSGGELGDSEANCMQNCFGKYEGALGYF